MHEMEETKVQGRSYTSNHVKLLKHMDRLSIIQKGGRPKPVMFHMSPCNPCNLTCSFCCFANRNLKEMLTKEQMIKAVDQFAELGVLGMEFTGDKNALKKLHEDIFVNRGVRLSRDTIPNFPESEIIADCYEMDKEESDKINAAYDEMRLELLRIERLLKKDQKL